MANLQEYKREVRNFALTLNEGETPSGMFLMEDVSTRTEKTFINKLTKEVVNTIEEKKEFNLPTSKEENMIKVMEARMNVLSK